MLSQTTETEFGRGVLLDTNLLILYLVGSTNPNRIGRFKRTQRYTTEDFDLLVSFLSRAETLFTTPHILTQVSDLVKLQDPEYVVFLDLFRVWVGSASESNTPSVDLVQHPIFYRVGLADAGIGKVAERGVVVLTDDFELYLVLLERELPVINFNHHRSQFRS